MEFILTILAFGFAIWFYYIIGRGVYKGGKAVYNAATGNSALSELSYRVINDSITLEDGTEMTTFVFQMKGLIPPSSGGLTVAISLFDERDQYPVMCFFEGLQEQETRCFLSTVEIGVVPKGAGFTDWTSVGYAISEALVLPRSGQTKLTAIYRFLQTGWESELYGGLLKPSHSNILYGTGTQSSIEFEFQGAGYLDFGDNSKIAQKQALRLAVDLALIDGEMHDDEGNVIKKWMQKYVDNFEEEERENMKAEMNAVMKDAYSQSSDGSVDRDEIINELKRVGQKFDFYETMELLMDIMAADDVAHKDELAFLNNVGTSLGVSTQEIQQMKDVRLFTNQELTVSEINSDQALGIDTATMSQSEICQQLSEEFLKWNARMQTITDEAQREKAQNMLGLISESRTRHCE